MEYHQDSLITEVRNACQEAKRELLKEWMSARSTRIYREEYETDRLYSERLNNLFSICRNSRQ